MVPGQRPFRAVLAGFALATLVLVGRHGERRPERDRPRRRHGPPCRPPPSAPALLPTVVTSVSRWSGANRYATAVAISQASFSPGVPVAYLATGEDFPDALAGAPVAGMTGGPLLLTDPTSLPSVVKTELARLKPAKIVVLGGTGVVSTAVATALAAYTTGSVSRWSGANRYATAVAISQASFSPGVPVAYLATGEDFPDALAGAPVAGMTGGPLLLTDPTSLPSVVKTELARLKPAKIVVLGGTGVVSTAVATALAAYTTGSVSRWSGANRYATAVAISKASFSPGVPVAYLATGENFPDALAGAPVAGMTGGPLLLTDPTSLPSVVKTELARLKPAKIVVLGGTGVVSTAVATAAGGYVVVPPTSVQLDVGGDDQTCVSGSLVGGTVTWHTPLATGISSVALYDGSSLLSTTSPTTGLAPGTYTLHVTVADGYELANAGAVPDGVNQYLLDVTVDGYSGSCAVPVTLVYGAVPQDCVAGSIVNGEIGWEDVVGVTSVSLYQGPTLISSSSPGADLAPGTYTLHVTVADGYELANAGAVPDGVNQYLLDVTVDGYSGSCAVPVTLVYGAVPQDCIAGSIVNGEIGWEDVVGVTSVSLYQGPTLISSSSPGADLAPGTYTLHVTVADGYELANAGAVPDGANQYLLDVTVDAYVGVCTP